MRKSTLFLFLFFLTLAYVGYRYFYPSRNAIFESDLIAIDTAGVTMLSIIPAGTPEGETLLKREGKAWIITRGNRSVKALYSTVDSLLASLALIESHHVVGKGPEVWSACGLDPGQGIRIRVFREAQVAEDFLLGSFEQLSDREGYTYVRLWDDESVFAVRGALGARLWPGFEAFRSKKFLDFDPEKVREVSWETMETDSAQVMVRSDSGWVFSPGGWQRGGEVDSFLRQIRGLEGGTFADAFDPVSGASSLVGRITLFATYWEAPVEVSCYRDSTENHAFVLYSTSNPDNYFQSDSTGLYRQLVQPFYSFFPLSPSEALSH